MLQKGGQLVHMLFSRRFDVHFLGGEGVLVTLAAGLSQSGPVGQLPHTIDWTAAIAECSLFKMYAMGLNSVF